MHAQVTLTVPVAKRIIAQAIYKMPEVQKAFINGKVILKGGTTVSAVSELMIGSCMRISGRNSSSGTKSAQVRKGAAHGILLNKGKVESLDDDFCSPIPKLKKNDVVIIGANAIDIHGKAAMMLGSPLGGLAGMSFAGIMAQGCKVIIACGLEKLIPNSTEEAVMASGIAKMDWSMGMSVGLAPLYGELITEKTALEMLADVKATVIGCGGVHGGEGSTTLVLEGKDSEVKKLIELVISYQDEEFAKHSFHKDSINECSPICDGCKIHRTCAWRDNKGILKIK